MDFRVAGSWLRQLQIKRHFRAWVRTDGTQVLLFYDDDGRMATMTTSGLVTSYAYDAAGNLLTTTLPTANGYV